MKKLIACFGLMLGLSMATVGCGTESVESENEVAAVAVQPAAVQPTPPPATPSILHPLDPAGCQGCHQDCARLAVKDQFACHVACSRSAECTLVN